MVGGRILSKVGRETRNPALGSVAVAGLSCPRFGSEHGRAQVVGILFLVFLLLGMPSGTNADPKQPAGTEGDRIHWSFQKVIRREPPPVQEKMWVANPIDAFLLSRLEWAGLMPTPPADRITIMRRGRA